jgi:hypothetical protein
VPVLNEPIASELKHPPHRWHVRLPAMHYVFNVLVLGPATTPFSLVLFFVAALVSSGFFRHCGHGIGLYFYAALTALIVVPFILFVLYVFLMAAPLWTFSEGMGMLLISLVITPLGAGWLIGMALGGAVRAARKAPQD